MESQPRKRYRRTKADIAEDIRKAAVDQILKNGFSSSLVTEIIKKAKIEPPVFYNRYKDLDEFFSEFVKSCDYLRISLRWYRCSGQMVPRGADAWYRL